MRNKHKKKMAAHLKRKQLRLGNLINLVLIQSYGESDIEKMRYYQGYHDISSIFLSSLGGFSMRNSSSQESEIFYYRNDPIAAADKTARAMGLDLPSKVLLKISRSHLRDSLRSDFVRLSSALRLIIMPLIGAFDSEVHSHLLHCQIEPFFALSWIITWFSHDIRDTVLVKRLFDFFIASHALMPIYMSIAMVLHPFNRTEVLSTECDFATVHKTLSQLPRNSCSVGWKLVGNASDYTYVSDEEERDDEYEPPESRDDESSIASSMVSSVCDANPVPFEDLINLSIEFM